MINLFEVTETNKMIEQENLDVRTITIGISLLDCMDHDIDVLCQNIYKKITSVAKDLVKTGEEIERKYGIQINVFLLHLLVLLEPMHVNRQKILLKLQKLLINVPMN